MKSIRNVIEINEDLCNGCGECVPSCAEGAIQIIDGKARLLADKLCDGLGACLGECPTGALRVVQREADEFDEEAVKTHLGENAPAHSHAPAPAPQAHACPGSQMRQFEASATIAEQSGPVGSALSHWPVQIRLLSPTAPYWDGAEVLVAADCVPVAYPRFHQDLLAGKSILLGCPKLDDMEDALDKFTSIFRANQPTKITVAVMEVPCCQRLPMVVNEALKRAGKSIPVECVTVGVKGDIVKR
jgi:Fe-S-cluster-containing hydrogenase component 2